MSDQQQQQMNIAGERSAKDIIVIAGAFAVIALGFVWGMRQVVPEWQPSQLR